MAPKVAVHFWLDDKSSAEAAVNWDPDSDPEQFSSGVGHALIEVYARLRQRGHRVTIGPRVPGAVDVVVWFPDGADPRATLSKRWQVAPYAQILIRGDRKLSWMPLIEPDVTIVPNRSNIWQNRVNGEARFIPLLPQRGLLPRRPERFGSLTTVAFKGNPENVPDYLRDASFINDLKRNGLSLRMDVPTITDGEFNRWHDFTDVDVTLCVRAPSDEYNLTRKPATRLINGWVAGSIPLIAPEPAYLELCVDGKDALVVEGPDAIIKVLQRLKNDPSMLLQVESSVRARGIEFSPQVILKQWEDLFMASTWHQPNGWNTARRRAKAIPDVAARVAAGKHVRGIVRKFLRLIK